MTIYLLYKYVHGNEWGIYVFQVVAAAGLRMMERMDKTEKGERVFFMEGEVAI